MRAKDVFAVVGNTVTQTSIAREARFVMTYFTIRIKNQYVMELVAADTVGKKVRAGPR